MKAFDFKAQKFVFDSESGVEKKMVFEFFALFLLITPSNFKINFYPKIRKLNILSSEIIFFLFCNTTIFRQNLEI